MEGNNKATKKLAVLGDLFIDIMALEVSKLPQWGGDAPCKAIQQCTSTVPNNTPLTHTHTNQQQLQEGRPTTRHSVVRGWVILLSLSGH